MKKQDQEISFATSKKNMLKFKLVFVGDQAVGKSSIINRFIKDQFNPNHNPTVGIDFVSKNFNIGGSAVRLQLWDTAGQERFRSLIPGYLRDCNAAFIVYDVTQLETYNSIDRWIDFVKEARGDDALIYIIGNKTDLQETRVVNRDQVNAKFGSSKQAVQGSCRHFEVSAKNGTNLETVFKEICADLLNISESSQTLNLEMQKSKLPALDSSTTGKAIQVDRDIGTKSRTKHLAGEKTHQIYQQNTQNKMGASKLINPNQGSSTNDRRVMQKNCC